MRKPECRETFFSIIFAIIGIPVVALGLLMLQQGAGMAALAVFEAGVLALMAFGLFIMWADTQKRNWYKARRKGETIKADSAQVCHHSNLRWGKETPWTILCRYSCKGKHYTIRSQLLWQEPKVKGVVHIRIDPKHPKRAWVDVTELSK